MALEFQVLGRPGRDNALWVAVDSGQARHRLLFDCGAGCLHGVDRTDLLALDHLFLSHFHMDHICGFDGLFRRLYNREGKPMQVWGPASSVTLMHHRFRSYWWNLHHGQNGHWQVRDIGPTGITAAASFLTREGFARKHRLPISPGLSPHRILETPDFAMDALLLEHHGPSVAYRIQESGRLHAHADRFPALGLRPGPWVRRLKDGETGWEITSPSGQVWTAAALREELLTSSPGASLAYLTDFLLDDAAHERLVPWLRGVDTLICESQYRHADLDLARKNCHATARAVGNLARDAGVGRLILMHLSERYSPRDWTAILKEARQVFPPTDFPSNWEIG